MTGGCDGSWAVESGRLAKPLPPIDDFKGADCSSSCGGTGVRLGDVGRGAIVTDAPGFFSFSEPGAVGPGAAGLGAGNFAGGPRAEPTDTGMSSFFNIGGAPPTGLAGAFRPKPFLGPGFVVGGGAEGFSFAFTTATSKNSLIFVFLMSSRPSM